MITIFQFKHILLYLPVLCLASCNGKGVIQNDSYPEFGHKNPGQTSIAYFDGTSVIQTIRVDFYEESYYLEFFQNAILRRVVSYRYLYNFEDFKFLPLNRYNAFVYYLENDGTGYTTLSYGNSFYSNGVPKTKLVCDKSDRYKIELVGYDSLGRVMSKRFFEHRSITELFTPIGYWLEFDTTGTITKEYLAPPTYFPDNW